MRVPYPSIVRQSMTEWNYNAAAHDPAPQERQDVVIKITRASQIVGGLMSLGLLSAIAYFSYDLELGDLSGVPVIKAKEGPMRSLPENPGGDIVNYQGLAVNAIAAEKGAADLPDKVILAPQAINLLEEDATGFASFPSDQSYSTVILPLIALNQPQSVQESLVILNDFDAESDRTTALDPQIIRSSIEEALNIAMAQSTTIEPYLVPDSLMEGGLGRSLRPLAPPFGLFAKLSETATQDAKSEATFGREISYKDISTGTRLVQLGAFSNPEVARAEWVRLSNRFSQLFADKVRIVQRAPIDNKIFFRLRAYGFIDVDDSIRFCAALDAEGAACIPAVKR
jgi:hypothetical protein